MSSVLSKLAIAIKEKDADIMIIEGTDEYFNEYVPLSQSFRAYVSDFTGSAGDLIVTSKEEGHLFTDGRYVLQAKKQSPHFNLHICERGIKDEMLLFLSEQNNKKILYDMALTSLSFYNALEKVANKNGHTLISYKKDDTLQKYLGTVFTVRDSSLPKLNIFAVPINIAGQTIEQKHEQIKDYLTAQKLDALLVTKLDDIAWLLNLRSNFYPFQMTFPCIALITKEKINFGVLDDVKDALPALPTNVCVMKIDHIYQSVTACKLALDEREASKNHLFMAKSAGHECIFMANPLSEYKATKNECELKSMRQAFRKADEVVHKTSLFIEKAFEKNEPIIKEKTVYSFVEEEFEKSGAIGLSFKPITGAGPNSSVIHYSTPDDKNKVAEGEIFLLDTGAYYEGGYATDLTRTFLAAGKDAQGNKKQKLVYTLVLKASIKGLSARFRKGSTGQYLDSIVRQPLWQAGIDFGHGTGHGIGISVHEFPPRLSSLGSAVLKENHVFSIEPGIYLPGEFGVRIENLACVVKDEEYDNFLRVLPLTFCPFDNRLIDFDMLDIFEKLFLQYYEDEWQAKRDMPNMPPINNLF